MLPSRFMSKVHKLPSGCWEWTGGISRGLGYGQFQEGSKKDATARNVPAHRFAYEYTHGALPRRGEPGHMQVDHECHNRSKSCQGGPSCRHRRCVNPDHLAAKPPRGNTLASAHTPARHNSDKTHCDHGHEFDEANTYRPPGRLKRVCRACSARREREKRARNRR